MLLRQLPSATMSTHSPLDESATAAELKKKQQQAVLIPKTSIQEEGGFVKSNRNLPLHTEIELLGKTIIIPNITKSNPKTSQILKEFRKGVKERQNTINDTKNNSVTIHKKDIIPTKDIVVIGQVVRNDNFKKASINSLTNPQSDHHKNLQNHPNGAGPICERILVHNDHEIHNTNNQHCIINTQNLSLTKNKRRYHSKQNQEVSSHNDINLDNVYNDSSPQDTMINHQLRQQYPPPEIPRLHYVKNFQNEQNINQQQKQHKGYHLPQDKTEIPPKEKTKGNHTHIQIPEQTFSKETEGRHPNLPWASQLIAPPWPLISPPWPPPGQPQVPQRRSSL